MKFRIDLKNLSFSVGTITRQKILDDVSLSFNSGELVGIIGPSGSGKSTLMKAICGFQRATGGTVTVNGQDLYKNFEKFKTIMGYVPQDDIIHQDLSIYKTLRYSALLRLPPETKREVIEAKISRILKDLELEERKNTKVKKLSGGQRKRVSIGVELLTNPEIMFLDEPTSGLDPALEEKMTEMLKKFSREQRLIFVTTHVMKSLSLLDLLIVMFKGKLVFFGKPQEALSYFGVEDLSGVFYKLGLSSPDEYRNKYRQSPYYSEYIIKRQQHPFPLVATSFPQELAKEEIKTQPNLPEVKAKTKLKSPEELQQELEELKKQLGS